MKNLLLILSAFASVACTSTHEYEYKKIYAPYSHRDRIAVHEYHSHRCVHTPYQNKYWVIVK